ncbi:MAG: methyltransferase domain-containing protein [Candidatus Binataceae bacterium]
MEHQDRHGILMRGVARWVVYSRPRAWLGMAVEMPSLLRGVGLPRGARCLDIATGLGWATAALARRDPSARIVALDYDGTILPRTREYLRSHEAGSNVALCRADAKRLPFRDGSFDLVLCLYGLHHFRGYLDALREIARVLKSSGNFALIDPLRSAGKPPRGHHGTDVPTRGELERMLGEAGFEIVRSHISRKKVRALTRKANQPIEGARA